MVSGTSVELIGGSMLRKAQSSTTEGGRLNFEDDADADGSPAFLPFLPFLTAGAYSSSRSSLRTSLVPLMGPASTLREAWAPRPLSASSGDRSAAAPAEPSQTANGAGAAPQEGPVPTGQGGSDS